MLGKRQFVAAALAVVSVTGLVVLGASTQSAAAAPTRGSTVRGSVADNGAQSADGGGSSQISGNGRYQIFVSDSNLQPTGPGTTCTCGSPPNDQQINIGVYVRDLVAGTTNLVSFGNDDNNHIVPENGGDAFPSISDDGRYISFLTAAHNIVTPPDPSSDTVVVCDRGAPSPGGVFAQAPAANAAYPADFHCFPSGNTSFGGFDSKLAPHLSGNASRIVWGERTSGGYPIVYTATLTYDQFGVLQTPGAPQYVSFFGDFFPAINGSFETTASEPQVSDDGNWIVAAVSADGTNDNAIIEADMRGSDPVLQRVDMAKRGTPNVFVGNSGVTPGHPVVSGDGSTVLYDTDGTESNGAGNTPAVYATDVDTAAFDTTPTDAQTSPAANSVKISTVADGSVLGSGGDGAYPAISKDGNYAAFVTDQPGMYAHSGPATGVSSCLAAAPGGTPPANDRTACQIVARDLKADATNRNAPLPLVPAELASPSAVVTTCNPPDGPCAGAGSSEAPVSLSGDGGKVSFDSYATDLVSGDTNVQIDAFVRTWTPTITATTPVFDPIKLGQDETAEITVTNTGFGPYYPGTATISGTDETDFSIVGNTCEAAALTDDQTCSIRIDFAPEASGTRTATFKLYPNGDLTTPTVTVTLTGSATAHPPRPLAPGDTTRTSVTNTGGQASLGGGDSMISGNGRWDVFVSYNDLAGQEGGENPTGYRKVFVRDLANPQHTLQISLGGNPGTDLSKPGKPSGTPVDGDSYLPSISDDGRFVSFVTQASNIAPITAPDEGDISYSLVVCDRDPSNKHDGAGNPVLDLRQANSTLPDYACYDVYSTDSQEFDNIDISYRPRLSGNGTHLVFTRNTDGDNTQNVFMTRLAAVNGRLETPTAPHILPNLPFYGYQTAPTISRTADRVAFRADRADSSNYTAIVELDINEANLNQSKPFRVDVTPGSSTSYLGDVDKFKVAAVGEPSMSGDGTKIAFSFGAYDTRRIYVATRNGDSFTSKLESLNNDHDPGLGFAPALSQDGRYLAFVTDAFNMHDGTDRTGSTFGSCLDTGKGNRTTCQIVAKDLVRNTENELVSVDTTTPSCSPSATGGSGCAGDRSSGNPSLDADGSEVGFDSQADDLVSGDTNQTGQLTGWRCVRAHLALDADRLQHGVRQREARQAQGPHGHRHRDAASARCRPARPRSPVPTARTSRSPRPPAPTRCCTTPTRAR